MKTNLPDSERNNWELAKRAHASHLQSSRTDAGVGVMIDAEEPGFKNQWIESGDGDDALLQP